MPFAIHVYLQVLSRMKTVSALLLALLVSITAHHVCAAEKYSVAYFNVPPHVIFDAETLTLSGALYDFLNDEIAPEMGIQLVWDKTPTNIPRQTQLLKDEQRDIAALMAITPERSELFSLSITCKNSSLESSPLSCNVITSLFQVRLLSRKSVLARFI